MKIHVLAVGKMKPGPLKELYDDYARRAGWPVNLREVEAPKGLSGENLKQREAELLLAVIPVGAKVIALDERGETPGSEFFARVLEDWQTQGASDVAFVIGGADGLAQTVRERADKVLSFGRMTFPHMLVRVLLAEQLYRARKILEGHPYHRA